MKFRAGELEHCGSGKPISARGDEFLVVGMRGANGHGYTGPRSFTTPTPKKVKSVSNTCDFEGHLDFAIGYETKGGDTRSRSWTTRPVSWSTSTTDAAQRKQGDLTMKKHLAAVLLAALAALAVVTIVPVASADARANLTGIRTGSHAHFERIVLDMTGQPGEDMSREVTSVIDCGRGEPVVVPGREILETRVFQLTGYDVNTGKPTYTGPRNFVPPGLTNVRGVAITCDFEGEITLAIGYDNVDSWHRVHRLTNPDRLVFDIYSY